MNTILYLGTDPSFFQEKGHVVHYPVIRIVPRSESDLQLKSAIDDLKEYTHLIFTSKNAVRIFFDIIKKRFSDLSFFKEKKFISVGSVTAEYLRNEGIEPFLVAKEQTQEGLIEEISLLDLEDAYVFFPRSSISRPVLLNFLKLRQVRLQVCDLYDTVMHLPDPKPDLHTIDEIIFTSPSTVDAFCTAYGSLPQDKKITAIGPITQQALESKSVLS